jgi:hypothetical protein
MRHANPAEEVKVKIDLADRPVMAESGFWKGN